MIPIPWRSLRIGSPSLSLLFNLHCWQENPHISRTPSRLQGASTVQSLLSRNQTDEVENKTSAASDTIHRLEELRTGTGRTQHRLTHTHAQSGGGAEHQHRVLKTPPFAVTWTGGASFSRGRFGDRASRAARRQKGRGPGEHDVVTSRFLEQAQQRRLKRRRAQGQS